MAPRIFYRPSSSDQQWSLPLGGVAGLSSQINEYNPGSGFPGQPEKQQPLPLTDFPATGSAAGSDTRARLFAPPRVCSSTNRFDSCVTVTRWLPSNVELDVIHARFFDFGSAPLIPVRPPPVTPALVSAGLGAAPLPSTGQQVFFWVVAPVQQDKLPDLYSRFVGVVNFTQRSGRVGAPSLWRAISHSTIHRFPLNGFVVCKRRI